MADDDDDAVDDGSTPTNELGQQLADLMKADAAGLLPDQPAEDDDSDETPVAKAEAKPVEDKPAEATPEPVAATPQKPELTPAEQAAEDARHRFAKETGYDVVGKFSSEAEFFKSVAELNKRLGKRDEEAELGRFVRENPEEAYKLLSEKYGAAVAAQTVAAATKPEPNPDEPPEYNENWQYMVEAERDAEGNPTGKIKSKPGVPPEIADKFTKAAKWIENRQRELLFNPDALLKPRLEQVKAQAKQEALDEFRKEQASLHVQTYQQQLAQHAHSLVSKDAGILIQNDQLTPAGQLYQQHLAELKADLELDGRPITPKLVENLHKNAMKLALADMKAVAPAAATITKPAPIATARAKAKPDVAPTSDDDSDELPEGSSLASLLGNLGRVGQLYD